MRIGEQEKELLALKIGKCFVCKQHKLCLIYARKTRKKRVRTICESCIQPESLPLVLIPIQNTDIMAQITQGYQSGVFNN